MQQVGKAAWGALLLLALVDFAQFLLAAATLPAVVVGSLLATASLVSVHTPVEY